MFVVEDSAVLRIENSTVRDCGWNSTNPGLTVLTDDIYFYDATFTGNFVGITLKGTSGGWIEACNVSENEHDGIALIGSSGRLELAIVGDNAAERLGVGVGTPVTVGWE